jgi:integrase/recombinase XerD
MTYQYKREPLSIEEADRLFSVADTLQEKLCVYGLLETGLRVSELAGLNKQQIQWQQGAIRIKGKGGPYGKKSKVRVIPLSRRLKPLLENFFVLNDKFPWTARTIQRVMKRIANKAGITKPLTPHVLRHTFSILWIHKGGSTRALQGILGHDHLSTTEIYLNMSPEHILQEFQSKW